MYKEIDEDSYSSLDDVFTLADLREQLANCAPTPKAYKALLKTMQAKLDAAFCAGADINLLIEGRAIVIDEMLKVLFQATDWDAKQHICLVAVGGYGRGELHPHSDIDLLILLNASPSKKNCAHIESLVTFLWDCGLDLGHSVRSVKECVALAKDDITVVTNLIESRVIAGDASQRELLISKITVDDCWSSNAFFTAKWQEQRDRHSKVNNIEYNLEPNIKESPGGLRDIQTIVWIAKRHLGETDISTLAQKNFLTDIEAQHFIEGKNFLWRVRYALHMIAGRHEERLLFGLQVKVAESFGFVDDDANLAVEKFMQEYYRRVMVMAELNDVLIQHFDQDIVKSGEEEEIIVLNERFVVKDGYIDVVDEQVFIDSLWSLMEVFVLMAQHNYIRGVRASTMRLIRTHRERIDDAFRSDAKVIDLFMQLLRSDRNVPLQLKRMRRHGVLSKYIPAFGQIIGKMQYDLFHIYTVDIHTLEVVQNVYNFAHQGSQIDYALAAKVINGRVKIEILYLAAIFHDIAKGRGGDHSELGAHDAREFCAKHGVSARDTNIVTWLVENHLTMSIVSQKQDLSDPDVIREFALKVGDTNRLDYLYVLTKSDIKATNPELWNAWRSSLMRELYINASRALRRGLENTVDKQELIEEKQAAAMEVVTAAGIDREEVLKQWRNRVEDYFVRESIEDIALHAQAIFAHGASQEPIIIIKKSADFLESSATQIIIYCPLQENRFAKITAALEKLNLSIHDARMLIAGGGQVLDTFYVLDAEGGTIDHDSKRITQIRERLFETLTANTLLEPDATQRLSRRKKSFDWPSQTVFSNDYTKGFSVLEVIAPDRPGLLSVIGQTFFNFKLRLHNAKISTLGERVEDVFFLTDRNDCMIEDAEIIENIQNEIKNQLDCHVNTQASL